MTIWVTVSWICHKCSSLSLYKYKLISMLLLVGIFLSYTYMAKQRHKNMFLINFLSLFAFLVYMYRKINLRKLNEKTRKTFPFDESLTYLKLMAFCSQKSTGKERRKVNSEIKFGILVIICHYCCWLVVFRGIVLRGMLAM